MSETTNIEWATSTGNPWLGCTKVSPGCKNCYAAELDANRFSRSMGGGTKDNPISHWGKGAPRVRTKAFWKDALKWDLHAGAQAAADNYDGHEIVRPRIFPSLCDWLDDEVPIEWLADFLKLMHDTPNLDWLLLTKRPENWQSRIEAARDCIGSESCDDQPEHAWIESWMFDNKSPENFWIGVSVEDQERADERIPLLLQIPAKVRFLSVEPLLSEIIFHRNLTTYTIELLDWAIVGAESGKDRRDCGIAALESAASQFVRAKVPCFVKQDCAFKPGQKGRIADDIWALKQFPNLLAR